MAFTNFSGLPTEIRLQIWRLAVPGGRLLKLSCMILPGPPAQLYLLGDIFTKRQLPLPTILHVCHESRAVACEILQHGFQISPPRLLESPTRAEGHVWWNLSADTVCFRPNLSAFWWGHHSRTFDRIDDYEFQDSRYSHLVLAQHLAIPIRFADSH